MTWVLVAWITLDDGTRYREQWGAFNDAGSCMVEMSRNKHDTPGKDWRCEMRWDA